jgi:hypothetical protein
LWNFCFTLELFYYKTLVSIFRINDEEEEEFSNAETEHDPYAQDTLMCALLEEKQCEIVES